MHQFAAIQLFLRLLQKGWHVVEEGFAVVNAVLVVIKAGLHVITNLVLMIGAVLHVFGVGTKMAYLWIYGKPHSPGNVIDC